MTIMVSDKSGVVGEAQWFDDVRAGFVSCAAAIAAAAAAAAAGALLNQQQTS